MIRSSFALAAAFLAGCVGDETLFKYGAAGKTWVLSELDGAPFTARATIEFKDNGKVAGQAPCNRFLTTQTEPYPWFKLDPIGSTKMACPDLVAERAYFAALSRMTLAEVGSNTLILSTDAGPSMIFTAE